MDYQSFQEFINKYDFDEGDVKFLNDIMKSCSISTKTIKPKKKLYSIRLNEEDMEKIKKMAKDQGLPYQTLISSVLHKYVA